MPRLTALLLILLCQGALLRAQDTESDNPTGPSGDFNGDVTTAGRYDPFTGNIKRQVTDLTVPGSNGAYPLAFSRTYNLQICSVGGDLPCFGDGVNWRHSYQWTLFGSVYNLNGVPSVYTVAYPDGAVITFRPGRASAPAQELPTFWRGPSGTTDRLEVQDSAHVYLHTADGGKVNFGNLTHPSSITDPTGAITLLTYMPNNASYLAQVTEPGGRWLKFSYVTATYKGKDANGKAFTHTWTLLNQVQASNGQTVTFSESATGSQSSVAQTYPYYVLTGASYDQETSTSGSGNVHASYGYTVDTGGFPTLVTAVDPHYAGAMVNIRYALGAALQERSIGTSLAPSEAVSSCVITHPTSTTTSSTETRGDKSSGTGNTSGAGANLTRTFNFGSAANPPTAKPSLLTSISDFEGYTSSKAYYGAGDPNGKSFLQSTTDPSGAVTTYLHEPITGRVTQVTFPDGRIRTASWRAADDTTTALPYYLYQTTDERGQTTTWHHYSNGNVYEIDYPDGSKESFQYAAFSGPGGTFYKLSSFTNKLGGTITYAYDEAGHGGSAGHSGLLTSVTRSYGGPNGLERTSFTYDSLDRVIQSADPRGVTESYTYNDRHQVVTVTHGDGTSVTMGYDDYGNCTSVEDENGNTKSAAYDEYRRLIAVSTPVNASDAAGTVIASRYEAFSYLRYDQSANVQGDALSNTNSNWGAKWLPTGSAVQRVYSPNGWCTNEYDGMYVNGSADPIKPAPANGYVHLARSYNPAYKTSANNVFKLITATDAEGFTSNFGYDNCNRLIKVTDPLGHVTTQAYYANGAQATGGQLNCSGLPMSVTAPGTDAVNALTATTLFANYNAMGWLRSVQDPSTHVFNSSYDYAGDIATQTDGINSTPYTYDKLGRKTAIVYPDGTTEQWTYDASSNLSTFKNRAGATCTYQYDGRNRCTSYSWSDGTSSVYYAYYPNSLLEEASNAHSDIKYSYDSSNALVSENEVIVQPTHLITRYTHDLDGNVDSIIYPSGHVPAFTHDNQERVTGMYPGGPSPGPAMSNYAYFCNWLGRRWLANGLATGYAYQDNGRLSAFRDYRGDASGNEVANGSVSLQYYGYAPDGQVSWTYRAAGGDQTGNNSPVENNLGDVCYYNPDGTLNTDIRNVNVTGGWPQANAAGDSRVTQNSIGYCYGTTPTSYDAYVYDAAGNRTQVCRDGQNSNYPAANIENGYYGWGYDLDANTANPLLGWTYQYNAENQLIQANGPGGAVILYYYDAEGRLCARNNNGVTTLFYYAGAQRIEERDANNNVLYTYYYEAPGSDRLLCRLNSSWGLVWYLYDGQGNTTHLCDNSGNVLERYLYDAFGTPTVYDQAGNQRPGGSAYDNRYLFKSAGGYEWQPQAQLYYCRERFYLPYHGRWLQPDPIGQEGGLNLYNYCENDPINSIDPSGLESETDSIAPRVVSTGFDTTQSSYYIFYGQFTDSAGNIYTESSSLSPNGYGGSFAVHRGPRPVAPNGYAGSAEMQVELKAVFGDFATGHAEDLGAYETMSVFVANTVTNFITPGVGETEMILGGALKAGEELISAIESAPIALRAVNQTTIDSVIADSQLAKGATTRGASLLQKRVADGTITGILPTQDAAEQIISDVLNSPGSTTPTLRMGQLDVYGTSSGQQIGVRVNIQNGKIVSFLNPNYVPGP